MKKRTDGRYQKQVTVGIGIDGKPIKKYIYADTRAELDKKYRDFMQLKDKGVVLKTEKITMQQLFEMWLENDNKPKVSVVTYERNRHVLGKMIRENFAYIPVTDFSLFHIEQYRNRMIADGTIATYNRNLSSLRSILDYGIQHDIIVRNVAKGASKLKYEPKKKRALTPYEVELVQNAKLDEMDRLYLDILYYTGMRSGEVLALEVEDIDFTLGRINVCKTINGLKRAQYHTKTKSGMRALPIPKPLISNLRAWCDKVEEGYLFSTRTGHHFGGYQRDMMWDRIKGGIFGAEEAPEDFTPHLFRHNYASDMYKAGVDLKTAQYLLGHSKIGVTLDIYTHFGKDDISIDRLETYYENGDNVSQKLVKDNVVPLKTLVK